MNGFRLIGDITHVLAIIILLWNIWKTRSCAGISGKSQILLAIVYTSRYLDLVTVYLSMYNTGMKMLFIVASYTTCYLIYMKFKATYDSKHDTFRVEFLIASAIILALLINHDFTFVEILWTFSIYLESVAILPQLFMVSKMREVESIIYYYLFALGSYRGLYILNWVYRYILENSYDLIAIVAGIVQTVLYCAFFLYIACMYITKDSPKLRLYPNWEADKLPHSMCSEKGKVYLNNVTMVLPNDIKNDSKSNIWMLSNLLPIYMNSRVDEKGDNFKISTESGDAIRGTGCDAKLLIADSEDISHE